MEIQIPVNQIILCIAVALAIAASIKHLFFSEAAKALVERRSIVEKLPTELVTEDPSSSYLGWETNLNTPIYFPNKVRGRHVHIIGATGSGKTESVIQNLIDQDAEHGYPIVILDAKGESTFLDFLKRHPHAKNRLLVFNPTDPKNSVCYNPLASGSPTDAAMRFFNSMTWSEEFYKTRSREMLMRVVTQFEEEKMSFTLSKLKEIFKSSTSLSTFIGSENAPEKVTETEFAQISGLVAQINQLCHGSLGVLISGGESEQGTRDNLNIRDAIQTKKVLYFRLPALIDPVTTMTVGRLLIAELAQYAAEIQSGSAAPVFTPIFLDEFGSLACPAFLELIAKARSAGLALHFSHQSLGDLTAAGESFASQINDNSSTKIVFRVHDPETADNVARTFGNKPISKETKQVIKNNFGTKQETGAMSVREVKEFRADPDLIKSLPTGCAYVLMNHAMRHEGSSGDVFRLRFPLPRKYDKENTNE